MDRTEFQPWKIENGTLRLNPWPAHTGRVVVTVDVFEPFEGEVRNEHGELLINCPACGIEPYRANEPPLPEGCEDRDATHADMLQSLFAHIDAHPQATFTLRTLHPERVREAWPAWANHACETGDCPHSKQAECNADTSRFHRPNVAIAAGPIRTQAEADRLLPELLQLSDLCREVYPVFRPVERIQLPLPCRDSVFWSAFPRIVVSGGPEPMDVDGIRSLRDQAVERGVRFVLQWGTWKPPLEITWRPSCPALDPPNNSLDTVPWPWESEVEA